MTASCVDLPAGWSQGVLSDFVEPRGEKVLPSAMPEAPFIGMDHVEAHTTRIIGQASASELKSAAARFYKGDVLYGRLRPYLNKVTIPGFDGLASAEFIVFPDTDLVRSQFLKYRLNASDFVSFAAHLNEGDRPRVAFDQIGAFPVLLPPSAEQRRIVAKIEELFSELDKGVEALTTAREQLKAYRQSVLKHAFDGKMTADLRSKHKVWRNVRLGDELEFLTSGSRGWADFYAKSGDTFIRAQNLKFDRLDLMDIAYVKLPEGNTEGIRTRVQIGDVLVTITGANVTKTGIVDSDLGKAYVSQHVALCRPCPSIKSRFLYWYLLSEAHGRRQLNDAAYGAGKPGLNLDNIKNVTISLPSAPEQAIVVERIETALSVENSLSESIETELQRTAALHQSILKQAFSGKLVAQAPSDEPASVLLERIRSERAKSGTTKASAKKQERKTRKARKEKEPVA